MDYIDGTLHCDIITIQKLQSEIEELNNKIESLNSETATIGNNLNNVTESLKVIPLSVLVNSEFVNSFKAYRCGNIVSVRASVIKVQGNSDNVVLVSGLPIPETDFIKSLITPGGNFYRYRLDENGVLHEHWTAAFDPSNGNVIEFQFTYICK